MLSGALIKKGFVRSRGSSDLRNLHVAERHDMTYESKIAGQDMEHRLAILKYTCGILDFRGGWMDR